MGDSHIDLPCERLMVTFLGAPQNRALVRIPQCQRDDLAGDGP